MWGQQASQQAKALQERVGAERQSALAEALKLGQGTPAQTIQPDEQGMGMTPMEQPAVPGNWMAAYGRLAQSQDPSLQQMGWSGMQGERTREDQQAFQREQMQAEQKWRTEERIRQLEAESRREDRSIAERQRAEQAAAALRVQLQQSQQAFEERMAREARNNRQPQQVQVIQTASGPMRLLPNGTAVPITGPAGQPVQPPVKPGKTDPEKTLEMYVAARDGLISGLESSSTGPLVGRLPAMSSAAQTAEGGVSAMAPVLKQIFRVAGEGTFTDKDQELLMNMVPTRTDRPDAHRQKIANIDKIIAAKLGLPVPALPPSTEKKPLAPTPENPQTLILNQADAILNGNR